MSDDNESKRAPVLGPDVLAHLGRQLRAMYAGIIAEGVPERFAEILRQLDEPNDEGSTPPAAP
jgi:Anti-sigma factor NepR